MIVFRYDKTFEGLLTAVFDAYVRKQFPACLLGDQEPGPIFVDTDYRVLTDREKAERVWNGLQRRLSRNVCRMLMYAWFSEIEGCGLLLMQYMRKVFDSKNSVYLNFSDSDVLEVKKLAQKVSRERMHLIQFVRFQKAADGTFFAPVSPKYNALPLSLSYFSDRFSDQRWLIYDLKRKYGYYYDLNSVEEITLSENDRLPDVRLEDALMAEDEKTFQELWRGYFQAITIRERINLRLQRQNMPRRFWKYLTEKQTSLK